MKSFCIPKSAAFAALCRANGIPARLHFADLQNQRIPDHLYQILGGNIMYFHCYAEAFLGEKWLKATPSFDLQTCLRHDLPPVEFDGNSDALFASQDRHGRSYCQYVADRGVYADVPLLTILDGFRQHYGHLKERFLKKKASLE